MECDGNPGLPGHTALVGGRERGRAEGIDARSSKEASVYHEPN
jgi:hypothetical protein